MNIETDEAARFEARVGSVLKGKWTLDQLLGVGGMAAVYAATHRNGKRVAIKMLHAELSSNPAVRQRFLREGYVANSVDHPGVVTVDDDDVADDGCAFLVMELLEGETFEARWQRKGQRLDALEVLSLMDQVLDALAAAHGRGIIHRDLKPENLFLTMAGTVKILDFGIARVRELGLQGSPTRTGSLLGTPSFMPPEQARGSWADVDQRTDLWAVGATMFTLLTGRLAHLASSVNEALIKSATELVPSLATFGGAYSPAVVAVVDRALAFNPADRWENAHAMQDALREAYALITNKPITLGDSIERDIPVRSLDRALMVQGATAMDGALATGARRSSVGSTRSTYLKAAVAACCALGAISVAAFTVGRSNRAADLTVSSAAAVGNGAPPSASTPMHRSGLGDHAAPTPVPVIALDRLPLAEAKVEAKPRAAVTKPFASASSGIAPVVSAPMSPESRAVANDPFAARR